MRNKVKLLIGIHDDNGYIDLYRNFSNYCQELYIEQFDSDINFDLLTNKQLTNKQLEKYNAWFDYPFIVFGSEANKLEFQMVFG